jgi:ribosomal-protein-alanine N-acetyltransferase
MLPNAFHTARLFIRPIAPEDAGPIFDSYAQDPEVTRFLTWRPHQRLGDTVAYIASCVASSRRRARTYVALEDGVIRGAIDLQLPEPHRIDVGYVLARSCWGRGLMTEVLEEVACWAVAQPKIFRIGAVCDIENVGSARVMEKAGLTREAVLRRWALHPNVSDEPRDCFSYARVR